MLCICILYSLGRTQLNIEIQGAGHPLRGYLENIFESEPNRKMTKAPPFLSLSFCN